MNLLFSPYNADNWSNPKAASRHHCAWHGQSSRGSSDNCSVTLVWTITDPDGYNFSGCANAPFDAIRWYAKKWELG